MGHTSKEYDQVVSHCRDLFQKKLRDYGSAWRILRLPSLTDQIYIKAQRLRSIEEKGQQKIKDGPREEYLGILNYSLMSLIQLKLGVAERPDLSAEEALRHYDHQLKEAKTLMSKKNHDYGEAWRNMRLSSITDLILQKLLRIKQIEENQGKTLVSEGLQANYLDMVNYAAFALIKLDTES